MTEAEFLRVFNRLCVALREPQDDSGMTQRIYFEALKDLSLEALQAGATGLQRETGRRFFPTTAEWRDAARPYQASQRIALALPAGRDQPWREECTRCGDTGWIEGLTCEGGMDAWPQALEKTRRGAQTHNGRAIRGNQRPVGFVGAVPDRPPHHAVCGRTRPHLPHTYTEPCACRPTNRTYQRHQAAHGG